MAVWVDWRCHDCAEQLRFNDILDRLRDYAASKEQDNGWSEAIRPSRKKSSRASNSFASALQCALKQTLVWKASLLTCGSVLATHGCPTSLPATVVPDRTQRNHAFTLSL
eukprot:5940313-Amphidinium_carterae.2